MIEFPKTESTGKKGGNLDETTEIGGLESIAHDNTDCKGVARRLDPRWGLYAFSIKHTFLNVAKSTCMVVAHRSLDENNE